MVGWWRTGQVDRRSNGWASLTSEVWKAATTLYTPHTSVTTATTTTTTSNFSQQRSNGRDMLTWSPSVLLLFITSGISLSMFHNLTDVSYRIIFFIITARPTESSSTIVIISVTLEAEATSFLSAVIDTSVTQSEWPCDKQASVASALFMLLNVRTFIHLQDQSPAAGTRIPECNSTIVRARHQQGCYGNMKSVYEVNIFLVTVLHLRGTGPGLFD